MDFYHKTRSVDGDFVKLGFRRWNGGLNWGLWEDRKWFRGIERGYVCFYMEKAERVPQWTIKGT